MCGIKDNALRNRLLQTPNLQLDKCIEMCRLSVHTADDVTSRHAQEQVDAIRYGRQGAKPPPHVPAWDGNGRQRNTPPARTPTWGRRSGTSSYSQQRGQCNKCGYKHNKGQCPAYGKDCGSCGKTGHFAKVCRGRPPTTSTAQVSELQTDPNNIPEQWERVQRDNTTEDEDELFVGAIMDEYKEQSELWYEDAKANGVNVRFKLDTGSEANILPVRIYNKIPDTKLRPPKCRLVTYTGQRVNPVGDTEITVNGCVLKFHITRIGSPILSKQACVELNLITRVSTINYEGPGGAAERLVNKYNELFQGLGIIKVNAHIHIDENVTPIVDPPRRIPMQ